MILQHSDKSTSFSSQNEGNEGTTVSAGAGKRQKANSASINVSTPPTDTLSLPQFIHHMSKLITTDDILELFTTRYEPLSRTFEMERLRESEELLAKRYKGSIYCGIIRNNLKNDIGVLLHVNGRVYEGAWKDDFVNNSIFL
jgi:hypothetical protein